MPRQNNRRPVNANTRAEATPGQHLELWRAAAITGFVLAGILAYFNYSLRHPPQGPTAAESGEAPKPAAVSQLTPVGPWGHLDSEAIVMERPARLLTAVDEGFNGPPPWNFGNSTPAEVRKVLVAADLTTDQRTWLTNEQNWRTEYGSIVIHPEDDLLMGLSTVARQQIYNHLAAIPGNPFKNDPFKMAAGRVETWFHDAGISAETEALIRRLLYPRGPLMCFSDLGLLGSRIPRAERMPVLQALSRLPARRAYLRIESGEVPPDVLNYWRRGGRVETMRPLIESLGHSATGGRIDVTYLLPRFGRERLYTFPDQSNLSEAEHVDCFWTALNFFRYPPDLLFVDARSRIRQIEDNYELITGQPTLGDVLVYYDRQQKAIHACVYVAGDLVFTKNGATQFAPWVLMSFSDLLPYYSTDGEPTRRVYRPRDLPAS